MHIFNSVAVYGIHNLSNVVQRGIVYCLQFCKNIGPLRYFTKGRFHHNGGWVNSTFLGTCLCPMTVCGFFHSDLKLWWPRWVTRICKLLSSIEFLTPFGLRFV